MKILVLGSGGREHALAWRMAQDPGVERVFVMPGNPGMHSESVEPLLIGLTLPQVEAFCIKNKVDFVMVGPEKFLFEGWVDELKKLGIPAVGPTRTAARLEESKSFSKDFMTEHRIPTARFFNVKSEAEALSALEKTRDWAGVVVKLSGPALGKGVVVTQNAAEARDVIQKFYQEKSPGIEGGIVIEEKLAGKEVSLFYACLDREFRFLASASDHKRLKDNDEGPNTGGMGAISPSPWSNADFLKRVEEKVVKPTLEGMAKTGNPYRGILFLGLMGDSMLEYNVRFGDPETQAILPVLKGNLSKFLHAIARGDTSAFKSEALAPGADHAIHVVKAAKGYPGLFGEPIEAGKKVEIVRKDSGSGTQWFFAGVKETGDDLVTAGGRVLGISAWAAAAKQAQEKAYAAISDIRFSGEQYRRDIGGKR